MKTQLSREEIGFLLETLKYTRLKFLSYDYPDEMIRRSRIDEVDTIIKKLKEMKSELPT